MTSMTPPTEPRYWHEVPNAPAPGAVLGNLHTVSDGTPAMLTLESPGTEDKPFRYLLLRSGDTVHAYVNRCAHFGVPLAARQEQLIFKPHASITCNVHYARYRWSDGVCELGDCVGESLMPIPVVVDAQGQICIAVA